MKNMEHHVIPAVKTGAEASRTPWSSTVSRKFSCFAISEAPIVLGSETLKLFLMQNFDDIANFL